MHGALALSPELLQQDKTVVIIAARRQSQQNEWELAQTYRTKVILSLELLSVATQGALAPQSELAPDARDEAALYGAVDAAGLPMSILNCYIFFSDVYVDKMVSTSLATRKRRSSFFRRLVALDARIGGGIVARLGSFGRH